jgi:cytosine/adenosine deaminase-related metal-dependent hydrolase
LLRCAAKAARERQWRLTTHLAESQEEFEMFMDARGRMYDWLKGQRDMSDCGRGSPVQHLERCGCLGENLLAVHVNCLARGDAALLGRRGVHVVHCPRSHDYFGRAKFPRRRLAAAGVNLSLGTDSLASIRTLRGHSPRLDLFAELRAYAGQFPTVTPEEIVRMVTVNAALALGRVGELGELSPGAAADLIAIPFSGRTSRVWDAVVHHEGDVLASMIDGRWVIAPDVPAPTAAMPQPVHSRRRPGFDSHG